MKNKRFISIIFIAIMAFSFSITASAESRTWSLLKTETEKNSTLMGLYNYGNIEYNKNDKSSKDGVNLYLRASMPGKKWKNVKKILAQPGLTVKSSENTTHPDGKHLSSWQGTLTSWWPNGKGCSATGKIHAHGK